MAGSGRIEKKDGDQNGIIKAELESRHAHKHTQADRGGRGMQRIRLLKPGKGGGLGK